MGSGKAGGGKIVARLLAVVAAGALIAGGLLVRNARSDDDDDPPTGTTTGSPPTASAESRVHHRTGSRLRASWMPTPTSTYRSRVEPAGDDTRRSGRARRIPPRRRSG